MKSALKLTSNNKFYKSKQRFLHRSSKLISFCFYLSFINMNFIFEKCFFLPLKIFTNVMKFEMHKFQLCEKSNNVNRMPADRC